MKQRWVYGDEESSMKKCRDYKNLYSGTGLWEKKKLAWWKMSVSLAGAACTKTSRRKIVLCLVLCLKHLKEGS